jgi:hypothetical protein
MLSTSVLYFSVAIFGERIESNEAHGLQLAERQTEGETIESGHNESQELAEQETHLYFLMSLNYTTHSEISSLAGLGSFVHSKP